MTEQPVRTAVLISGKGSNMKALLDATRARGDHPAEIQLVLSDRPDARGIEVARKQGVQTLVVDHSRFSTRDDFERELERQLHMLEIELIALAGFMRILTKSFADRWAGQMINVHPSLLPKHKGLRTHSRVLEAGDTRHGASVHWVSPQLDGGDVILQDSLSVHAHDTAASLTSRVKRLEHRIYPQALEIAALQVRQSLTYP